MEENIIILKQEPIISYDKIESVGQEVAERISDLNLENQIVTEDSISAVKKTRAELNKEFEVFEKQRKLIKEAVHAPYSEFEDKYKKFIAKHYNAADDTLKRKISNFEDQLKSDKENEVNEYFTELCQSKGIDFINISKLGLKITLSASLKSLKDQVNAFVEARAKDLETLENIPKSDEFKNEVLFEYKKSLDMPSALRLVQERHKATKEAEFKKQAEVEAKAQERTPVTEPQKTEPLQAPKVEAPEIYETTFKVQGTKEQLKALKHFIIDNNIKILE